jgi:hypothetical protein
MGLKADGSYDFSFSGTPSGGWDALSVTPAPQSFNWMTGNAGSLPGLQSIGSGYEFPAATAPTWNNPYAFTPWGAGLPTDAGFGTKLGSFLGGNGALILGGLQTLGGLTQAYTGLKGLSLAQKAFNQQRKEFNINLANQTQSYNTEVGDRISGRHYNSEAERQAALAAAQLVDRSKYAKGG